MSLDQYFYNKKTSVDGHGPYMGDKKDVFYTVNRRGFHLFIQNYGRCTDGYRRRFDLQEACRLLKDLTDEVFPVYLASINAINDFDKVMEDEEIVNGRPLEFYAIGRAFTKEAKKHIDHMYDFDCYENDGTLFVEFIQALIHFISEMGPDDELEYFAS